MLFDALFVILLYAFNIRRFGFHRDNLVAITVLAAAFVFRRHWLPHDPDGWDPANDTVGPGIYSGRVQRDATSGEVLYGKQYQGHNPWEPGPLYDRPGAGERATGEEGYSFVSRILRRRDVAALRAALETDPYLAMELSTGKATPLHTLGMLRDREGEKGRAVTAAEPSSEQVPPLSSTTSLLGEMAELLLSACERMASRKNGEEPGEEKRSPVVAAALCVNSNFDSWGYTPLHRAAGNDAVSILRTLLSYEGVDREVKSKGVYNLGWLGGPETPLDTARKEGSERAEKILLR